MNLKNEKGVTLVILALTITILLLVTGFIVSYSMKHINIKKVNNLYSDIEKINAKVSEYYLRENKLPVYEENPISKDAVVSVLNQKTNNSSENLLNPNDGDIYYVINLSKLENLTLNYGKIYKNWTNTSSSILDENFKDLYIINEITHQIYYLDGIAFNNEYSFSIPIERNIITPILLEDISDANFTIQILNVDENIDKNGIIYLNAKIKVDLNTDFKLETLEYAWAETGNSDEANNIQFTKFTLNNNNNISNVSSKGIETSEEKYYLWIKIIDNNGKTHYKITEINLN